MLLRRWNDLDYLYLFAILCANWLLHDYMHMHTYQIKQNVILFGTEGVLRIFFMSGDMCYIMLDWLKVKAAKPKFWAF
jgi:hypothetical protein